MIKENTEPKDEHLTTSTTLITSPASTINHTVQQRTNNNSNKWKQISLQGLDVSPQQTKISTPPLNSSVQRSIRRTATVIHPNTMTTSSITNDPRRAMACNDITLPMNSNQTNSFLRRRTQQHPSTLIDDNTTKNPSTTFSLLRQHSSPTNPRTRIDKSAYDNLTTEPMTLERKSSYSLTKKTNRHPTNDSLASDAYDNYSEKNGYDNYPMIRKAIGTQNEFDDRQSSTPRNDFNTKRSQSINLKTSFTTKSNTNDENKRSGSAHHHRTAKSITTTTTTKDPLCNLNATSCSPLNEHIFNNHNNVIHQQSPILRHISSPSLQTSVGLVPHQQMINHTNPNSSMESSTILPANSTFDRLSYGRNRVRKKQPRTNPNYVNIEIKSNDGSLRSTYIRIHDTQKSKTNTLSSSSSSSTTSSSTSSSNKNPTSIEQEYLNESNDTIHNHDEDNQTTLTSQTGSITKQFVTCTDEFLFHSANDPINLNSNNETSVATGDGGGTNSNTSTLSSPTLPIYYDGNSNSPPLSTSMTPHSLNRSHEPDSSTSSLTRPASIHLQGFNEILNNQTSMYKQWTTSSPTKAAPAAIVEIESDILLHEMLNFNTHKRGLFGKRLTQDDLLSWSKEPLTKPLLRTLDKVLKKEAPEIFKLIQTYMGDKKSKQIASLNTCLELTTKGWSLPSIRDELYLQLIKQTSYNINAESLQRGWELMAVCLSFFPPSSKFQCILEKYISLQTNGDADTPEVPISIYAKVCQKRLDKILQTGPKKGLKKPTFEEIELSKVIISINLLKKIAFFFSSKAYYSFPINVRCNIRRSYGYATNKISRTTSTMGTNYSFRRSFTIKRCTDRRHFSVN